MRVPEGYPHSKPFGFLMLLPGRQSQLEDLRVSHAPAGTAVATHTYGAQTPVLTDRRNPHLRCSNSGPNGPSQPTPTVLKLRS
ncbi:hypothetical protein Memar_0326 [Methanoculleus marisnigri JR1]|uniref:Uncharacterized protein n=1 Tax=Methanoculleus marisnigri (strain ATCC 35101 / DSM 1498 / JR1) TaxID=368407 RepID=A3CSA9_METMJ|nr:hypothetical protein Memar_0326 [Methanoculleus marisnigri JR1]